MDKKDWFNNAYNKIFNKKWLVSEESEMLAPKEDKERSTPTTDSQIDVVLVGLYKTKHGALTAL